jgi:small subunit ribosomal protein S16
MVSIRLRREGTKNSPYYRLVVANQRSPRDGKFIEQVGVYDPRQAGSNAKLAIDRLDYWISQGAQPSDTVASLLRRAKLEAGKASAAVPAAA